MAKETAENKLVKMMQKKEPSAGAQPAVNAKKFNFVFSIDTLNKILFLGIIGCLIALVLQMRAGFSKLQEPVDFSDAKNSPIMADVALPSAKKIDFYLEKVNARNIFKPYEGQAGKASGDLNLAKRMSAYKIVGIAWLDLPETASVMIEDSKSKQTYFLKQGEQLEGVTVKTIYTDRVVFSYENEETTIKL